MGAFLARRALWSVFVVWIVMTIVFGLMNVLGDRATAALGPNASPEARAEFRKERDLDKPLPVQYVKYMMRLVQGDLGLSDRGKQPVTDVILTRLPRSLLLGSIAIFFEVLLGLVLGTIAAVRRNTWFDTGFMALAFLGISAPSFLTGLVFLDLVAFRAGWVPVGGYGIDFLDHVRHALLPAFTLAILGAATYARVMRSELSETMRSDFIRTARAKGVSPLQVILRHGVRNALLPIATLIGLSLTILVSGAIITETIYGWPGVGRLAIEAILNQDTPVVMGVVLIVSLTVQAGSLLADVAVAALDPRIRLEGGR